MSMHMYIHVHVYTVIYMYIVQTRGKVIIGMNSLLRKMNEKHVHYVTRKTNTCVALKATHEHLHAYTCIIYHEFIMSSVLTQQLIDNAHQNL